ncbi:hypothetical protein DIS24_g10864 [Lasiodiplodia hormozganensis]|uniref:Xylanolytic transcriptional activator regulatory domain-containing protein n=1 Tax=Lasiodiplodia hormozganensis TaxID=869390 RepID=A0AA40C7G5_9PEZI|nr:hypothetical protein DIS24_g10864 [Lasiodiplodia hormozganensis]
MHMASWTAQAWPAHRTRQKRVNNVTETQIPTRRRRHSDDEDAGSPQRAKRRRITATSNDVNSDPDLCITSWWQKPQGPQATLGSSQTLSPSSSDNSSNGVNLSTIIHPSHETQAASPGEENFDNTSGFFLTLPAPSDMIMGACRELDISLSSLRKLIDAYFTHMTTFSLFHQPSFGAKIQNVKSPAILKAGFAAMLAYSARFETPPPERVSHESLGSVLVGTPSQSQFHRLSLKFVEDAIAECADEPPSLCLLQALILTTFNQLVQGVRGRAWRSLGLCVRMAYELGLHAVDAGEPYRREPVDSHNLTRWCFDEERRRAWWAIWEMDAFASTIRRCPLGVDWEEMETCLPVLDRFWFERRFQRSCFFEAKPIERVRALRECGSESPAAWMVAGMALMREAHLLSKPKARRQIGDAEERAAVVRHALRCYEMSLPDGLRYRNEYLGFEPGDSTNAESAKFNIYCTSQLATLMLYQNHLGPSLRQPPDHPGHVTNGTHVEGLRECIEASDNMFTIIKNSSRDHIQHVNPFISSTVWFAAAVQLSYKFIAPPGTNPELMEAKVELLRTNCQQYADFWNTPDALLENLSTFETHLKRQLGQNGNKSDQTAGQQSQEWDDQLEVPLLSPDSAIPPGLHGDASAINTSGNEYHPPAASTSIVDPLADLSMANIGMELDFSLDVGDGSLCLDSLLFDSHTTYDKELI